MVCAVASMPTSPGPAPSSSTATMGVAARLSCSADWAARLAPARNSNCRGSGTATGDPVMSSRHHALQRAGTPAAIGHPIGAPSADPTAQRRQSRHETTSPAASTHRRRPDRHGGAPADERQGSHGLCGAVRRRHTLCQDLQGGDAAQLPPGRGLHRKPQGQEFAFGPGHGQGFAFRPPAAGGRLAERRGRRPVPPGGRRRACAQALQLP